LKRVELRALLAAAEISAYFGSRVLKQFEGDKFHYGYVVAGSNDERGQLLTVAL
jgi:hypothetical protein